MKYCFFFCYGTVDRYIFKDLNALSNVQIFFLNSPKHSKMISIARRIHRSELINTYINLPWKSLWEDFQGRKNYLNQFDCFVFTSYSLVFLDWNFLRDAKNNGHKMVLIIYDSLSAHSSHLKVVKRYIFGFEWDMIISFDSNDCMRYGFTPINYAMYSILDVSKSTNYSDIYFIGSNKYGRNDKVKDIYLDLVKNKVSCNFNFKEIKRFSPKKKAQCYDGLHIFYNQDLPYHKVVSDVMSTNVILEYLQDGQRAQSLRYYEAVCYNKKLLTNNVNITKMPFYNSHYMKVFTSFDDIDIEWVKKKEDINYGYGGEFSPIYLLKIIEMKLHVLS